jgi:Uma2 family endonuclease
MHLRSEQSIICVDSELEPDLAVVQGGKADYRYEHPHAAELVIEICVTSHDYDRSKLHAYAGVGVKECWLVLGPERQIEVFCRPTEEYYAQSSVHGPGGSLTSTVVPGFTVNLDHLFAA